MALVVAVALMVVPLEPGRAVLVSLVAKLAGLAGGRTDLRAGLWCLPAEPDAPLA